MHAKTSFITCCLVFIFIIGVAHVSDARAHLPDTSYARIRIEREQISTKLTYDITSLVRILPSLDANKDHRLTRDELLNAVPSISGFLKANVAFELDAEPCDFGELQPVSWPLEASEAIAEGDYHAATSLITFNFAKSLAKAPSDIWFRFDFFESLGLRHTVLGAIEHAGNTDEVLFSVFEPDYFFDTAYVAMEQSNITSPETAAYKTESQNSKRRGNESIWVRLKQFFVFGVEHILIGYDHILFLLSLIVVSRFGELVKIVTAFTIAHSITLTLATLRWVDVPATLVEALIAATIVYTAIENFWIRETSGRWKLTFLFGLIHGFGFAGVLRELQLPAQGFVRSLLAFNLGVEVGQLVIVVLLALPIAWLTRQKHGKHFQHAISAIIALFGLGWFLDRALGFSIMPF